MNDNLEKFRRWYVEPIEALDGHASFITLAVALFLFERYYRIAAATPLQPQDQSRVGFALEYASVELNLNKGFLLSFWKVYRHGLLHQGMPQAVDRAGIDYKWRISGKYGDLPTEFEKDGVRYICLNPGGFFQFIKNKYLENEEALEGIVKFRLGSVFQEESEPVHHQPLRTDAYP